MELTIKKDINYQSKVLKHNVVTQAVMLLQGREGSLKTELEIYTVLAIMENLVEENLIELCNNDTRDLIDIMASDIEPMFNNLLESEEFNIFYNDVFNNVMRYCDRVYAEQHSMRGLLDTIVDLLASLDTTEVQEVLEKTGEMAAAIKTKHNETMEKQSAEYQEKIINKQEEISDALRKVMANYNITIDEENNQ